MSRQSNAKSIDFALIEMAMNTQHPGYQIVIITKTLEKSFLSRLSYYFNLYKQMYHLATSKACVVDSYIIPVSNLKHKKELLIIQIGHGLVNSKKMGYQTLKKESGRNEKLAKLMNMHRNYDYVISTSKETSPYLAQAFNVDISKILDFGPPKLDYILDAKSKKHNVLSKYPKINDKSVILYVSTFRTYKDDYLDKFIQHMPLEKYNIIIHLHPLNDTLHPEYDDKINQTKGVYRCGDVPTVDLLSIADHVVTDYSSFMFEAAIVGVPVYLFVPDYDKYLEKNGLNVDLLNEFQGAAFKDAKQLFQTIDKNNYDFQQLEKFKNKHIENADGNSTKKLISLIVDRKVDG